MVDIVSCDECNKFNSPECPRSFYSNYTGEWITEFNAKFCEEGEKNDG